MVIRGVELGRRAAAGGRGRRVREEFVDWKPRRLKNRGGVSGTWKTGAREDTGDPGRHTGSSGAGRERTGAKNVSAPNSGLGWLL